VTCSPEPSFTISKLQSIAGSGQAPTAEQLSGKVGQTVDYQVTVTNTGNTPLTFSQLTDAHCDRGTIQGGSLAPIEPSATLTYTCEHTLTTRDQAAGSYVNVASISAIPEQNEGDTIHHESNAVVVDTAEAKAPEEKHEGPPEKQPEGGGGKHEESTPQSQPTLDASGSTAGSTTTVTNSGKGGVLGFTSATIPALRGPQGCARSAFVASIRAAGVSSVSFVLDGHRIARLTARNARGGLLSVRINPASLRVGAHRLLAEITMDPSSTTARAARATRRLTVIRCASTKLKPKFTG